MTALVDVVEITKDYGRFRALDRVSLQIESGVTGLLGPNGAGKTTLIKVLLGLVKTTSGRGRLLDFELGRQNREIRAHVGYMPEDDCFLHGLTGVECVQFVAQLSRFPAIEALRRAHEILDFCGLAQERYRTVETYSTGMRQKLRFAQAIVHDPLLLILDEPTSGLDPEERQMMLNRIRLLGSADRFIDLIRGRGIGVTRESNGTLVLQGAPDELAGQVWHTANECGVGVRSLTPSQNSLEEIFLKAVREEPQVD